MKGYLLILIVFFLIQAIAASDEIAIPLIADYGRGVINSMAWNPAGDVLAVASGNGIWFYDADFNTLGHWGEDNYTALAWSASGNYLAVTYKPLGECRVQVLSFPVANPTIVYEELNEAEVCSESFSWHGDALGFAANGLVKIMEMNHQTILFSTEVASLYLNALSISPDGNKLLLVSGWDFWLWDINGAQLLLEKHIDRKSDDAAWLLNTIAWDENNFYVLCQRYTEPVYQYLICSWDIETGEQIRDFPRIYFSLSLGQELSSIKLVSPTDILYASYWSHGDEFNWLDTPSRGSFSPIRGRHIDKFALHPNGESISFGTGEGYLIQYSLSENRILSEKAVHSLHIHDLAWHPSDGRLALSAFGPDYDLQILQFSDSQFTDTSIWLETEVAEWVYWSETGDELYFGGNTGGHGYVFGFTELNGTTYEPLEAWYSDDDNNPGNFSSRWTAFSRDRSRRAQFDPFDSLIRLDSGIELPFEASLSRMEWSADNRFLAVFGGIYQYGNPREYYLWVWDTNTEALLLQESVGENIQEWQWSPDSRYLNYETYKDELHTINFIPVLAENELEPMFVSGNINVNLVWSPDSQYLLIASNQMDFYAIPTQELVASIDGWYSGFDWRADGHYLAGSRNGRIFVWDTSALLD
jgi:WD40 repeat protein